MLLALGSAVCTTKGWSSPESEEVYFRARELCRDIGETPQLYPAMWGVGAYYEVAGEYQLARETIEQNLNLARRTGDSNMLVQAYHQLGYMQPFTGELEAARLSHEELLARYDSKTHHPLARFYGADDPAICCLGSKSIVLWLLGYPDQGLRAGRAAVHLALQLSDPISLALAGVNSAILHGFRREPANAVEQAQTAIAKSEEYGMVSFLEWATFAYSVYGPDRSSADGAQKIRQKLPQTKVGLSMYLGWLAEAALEAADYREADAALVDAFAIVEGKGERIWKAELLRLRGELKSADPVEAEADFRRAIEVARSQHARSLELRATMSLARLLDRQGKRDEARTMLAQIYGWFTEGFDTADLKDAKALLDELRP
jgi:predicted ATPase